MFKIYAAASLLLASPSLFARQCTLDPGTIAGSLVSENTRTQFAAASCLASQGESAIPGLVANVAAEVSKSRIQSSSRLIASNLLAIKLIVIDRHDAGSVTTLDDSAKRLIQTLAQDGEQRAIWIVGRIADGWIK
jgi:hypothetical protein